MKRIRITLMIVMASAAVALAAADDKAPAAQGRHIDLAVCLDTSNSMDGLIDSAKQKLWAVVNELATAKPRPIFRVALYQYGNNSLDKETGWVQKVCDLSDDLDTVYDKLFKLTTNGGTEYVARVVRAATDELKWDTGKDSLRIIFVAGNEPATQDDKLKLQDICAASAAKGIIINTIFCGPEATGRESGWADAAKWADGRYASIDQDKGTVVIATPYDKKLVELGAGLNTTYVGYGARGKGGAANQAAQDQNALTLGEPAMAQRAAAKAGDLYKNAGWDLVDATKDGTVKLAEVDKDALPAEMKKMAPEEQKAYLEKKATERAELQKQIAELNAKREAFVKEEMTRKGLDEKASFDAVLRSAVREQAVAKAFTFEAPPVPAEPKPETPKSDGK